MRVLITGANGFIGRAVADELRESYCVRSAVRSPAAAASLGPAADARIVGDLGPRTEWGEALPGVDAVVHLAARVHMLRDDVPDPLEAFRSVNVAGTERLAREAAAYGVRRFVYVSSVGVNGSRSGADALTEASPPRPHTPYALSKWEAEQRLEEIGRETGMEIVVLRPPLVYGPGAPGNFARLARWVRRGFPLPLGRVRNERSMVYVRNLAAAVELVVRHPNAAGEVFFVADDERYSTPALVRTLARLMGRSAPLVPVPLAILRAGARLAGRGRELEQLTGSLVVSTERLRTLLGWEAPHEAEDGLAESIRSFGR